MMFDFLRHRGLGDLAFGQHQEVVVSLLGEPTDFSVQPEPRIPKWSSLQCHFDHQIMDFIGVYFEMDRNITLPAALKPVEMELNRVLPHLLDAIIRSGSVRFGQFQDSPLMTRAGSVSVTTGPL